jgi:mannose-1-phosphate guanylyltransferase
MRFQVIMAGGGGTRLWPASRRAHPKQLLDLGARPGETLLAATARRLGRERTLVVAGESQADGVRRELPWLAEADLLAEPVGRNTAAALGLAAFELAERDADTVFAAMPADHHIGDEAAFSAALDTAFRVAEARDVIVTIGIRPTGPETGYGYLELGDDRGDGSRAVARFVEKPDAATAQGYVDAGADRYLWNGGMFILRAGRLLRELERHMPDTWAGLQRIHAARRTGDLDTVAREYEALPSVSIDYGVMEKADDVVTVAGDFDWHDVGSWSALRDYRDTDTDGNVVQGAAVLEDAKRNVIVSDGNMLVAAVGVDDMIIVQSGNAVLVIPRDRAQDVRKIADQLRNDGRDEYL